MKVLVFGLVAVALALLLGSLSQALYQIFFGVPAKLLMANALARFYMLGGYQTTWSEILFCICSFVSCAVFGLGLRRWYLAVPVGIALIGWILIRSAHLSPLPLARIGGVPGWGEYLLYGLGLASLHILAGFLVSRLWAALWPEEPTSPVRSHVVSRARGFTMIEVLTVVGIIAVLAAILFPILVKAKRSARYAEDLSGLRQVYVAITIYENDSDRQSPPSLLTLTSTQGLPAPLLQSKTDPRSPGTRPDWPANIWVDNPEIDGANAALMSPSLISFGYLKPFENRFPKGTVFATYRDDPNVALLIDPAVGECREPSYTDDPRCIFPPGGQPPFNIDGWVAIRTDGSATRVLVPPPPCHSGAFSYEQLFLFWPVCGGARAGGN